MGKKIRKWLCVVLAVVSLASSLPLIAGALAPSAGESLQEASANGQAPLKVEIKSNKEKYTLLGKMEFTATITNTSNSPVEDISAQALLGSSLRPLKKESQFTATKASLAPNESFSFTYYADLKGLKGLDNLLLPVFWVSSMFHGGKAEIGNAGAADVEASKTVGLVSLFSKSYDTSTSVGVWHGGTEIPDPNRKEVEMYDYKEEDISEDESGMLYLNNIVSIGFTRESAMNARLAVVKAINGEVVGHRDMVAELQVKISKKTLDEIYDLCDYLEETFEIVEIASPETLLTMDFFEANPADPWPGEERLNWADVDDPIGGLNWWLKFIKAPSAWLYSNYMNTPVKIGIIDSGFDTEHDDLQLKFINKENEKKNYHKDHGTHVAGIIGATWNNKGVNGVVPNADMWVYAVADNAKKTTWNIKEIYNGLWELVRSGCKIINVSGGYSGNIKNSDKPFSTKSNNKAGEKASREMGWLLEETLQKGQDFLVVQSAGNGAKDDLGVDTLNGQIFSSITEKNCFSSDKVSQKQIMDRVIVVTASDFRHTMPAYANGGEQVAISAPGLTAPANPNTGNLGSGIYSTMPNNQYGFQNGTSMATPMVAGVATLVWSINPSFKADKVKSIVCNNTNEWVADNKASPNAVPPSDRGYRLVNAKLAVEEALRQSGLNPNHAFGEYTATVKDRTLVGGVNPPLASVNVKAINAENTVVDERTTDSTGKVNFTLPVGEYSMVFSKAGYKTATFKDTIVQGEPLIYDDIWLSKESEPITLSTITGKVLEQGTNTPLSGVKVEATKVGSTTIADSSTTSATGGFILMVEPDTAYDLKFTKAGYTEQTRVNISVGEALNLADVVMAKLNAEPEFAGGTGTEADPYLISTPAQLNNLRKDLTAHYKLTNDIDLADWGNWDPIGTNESNPFKGIFDGNGYSIKNMSAKGNAYGSSAGLFGYLDSATIKNTGIVDSTVGGAQYVGGIAGFVANSSISNCYAARGINGSHVGGYAGAYVGGIVGVLRENSDISSCYNTGGVSATASAGGIAGVTNSTSSINNCYNTGEIDVERSGSATSSFWAGGIVGNNYSKISNCYNAGTIKRRPYGAGGGVYDGGGIAGNNFSERARIDNCYFLDTSAPAPVNSDNGILTNVLALTESQMKQQASFGGFDFTSVWTIASNINNGGYPCLQSLLSSCIPGGIGTVGDPYLISTPSHLDNVRNDLTAHYKLINNINLANWGEWEPIGFGDAPFSGVLDGAGYAIKNMTITNKKANAGESTYVGLFGVLVGEYINGYYIDTVKNVGMVNTKISITNDDIGRFFYVGAISGSLWSNSRISNCYNTGTINVTSNTNSYVGGITGYTDGAVVNNCFNMGAVSSTGGSAGGIVGNSWHLSNCYNTGAVTATRYAGGIAGYGSATNCYYLDTSASKASGNIETSTNLALTEAQMKQQASFVGFDFDNVWAISPTINNSYPYLRGMQP